jgi:taurine dioxygenase
MSDFGTYYTNTSYQDIWDNPDRVRQHLLEHKVLVFRNIKTSLEDQIKLMEHLYPSSNHLRILKDVDHAPLFDLFSRNAQPMPGEGDHFARWHTDDSWLQEPVDIDCIHMYHLDDVTGGQTRWVDLEKIYTLLDEETLSFVKSVKVKKQWNADDINDPLYREESENIYHPALRTHPQTGKTSIFYPGLTTLGKDQDKWSKYNEVLFKLFEDHNNIFMLDWKKDDLVIWDNRCTAHCLMGGFSLGSRIFNKIEIGKSKPFYNEVM